MNLFSFILFRDSSNAPVNQSKNPHNPIKEDLIHSIFDDLWSEIYPKFNGIVTKLTEGTLLFVSAHKF